MKPIAKLSAVIFSILLVISFQAPLLYADEPATTSAESLTQATASKAAPDNPNPAQETPTPIKGDALGLATLITLIVVFIISIAILLVVQRNAAVPDKHIKTRKRN